MTTIEQMVNALQSDAVTEHNTRMCYIQRVFEYNKCLGVEEKQLSRNKYYYNDLFDCLYDMELKALEAHEQIVHEYYIRYTQTLNMIEHE